MYQVIHDGIHAKSGQESTLKLQYLKTEKESIMGWVSFRSYGVESERTYVVLVPDYTTI